ncbi:MAG: SDR family oxidoreductase [Ignavibacteriaceae bacterium]|jgi:decaprenylphospho-beta-D-erythro-pentofuranosid-2-ulose 2-reductase|nr:SDR family oxidoreductase [Ignavibacteriaceae bacterium]
MKNCLIIGAGSDVAKALAVEFAKEGFNLQLAGRNVEDIGKTAADLQIRYGIKVETLYLDVLKFETHPDFFNNLNPKPEVVVAAAGLLGDQKVTERDQSATLRVINTNFTGIVSLLNEFANYFENQGSGSIIGISSVAGDRGRMKNYIYGAAKAGFTAYLSGLRQRLSRKGVEVLSVQPGFINTKMLQGVETPKPLTAEPEQVAKMIYNGFRSKKHVIYTPGYWRVIMFIVRSIPERIFVKLDL